MQVDLGGDFVLKGSELEKRLCCLRERPARQVDLDFVGENENRSPGHAFGYERGRAGDKPFFKLSQNPGSEDGGSSRLFDISRPGLTGVAEA